MGDGGGQARVGIGQAALAPLVVEEGAVGVLLQEHQGQGLAARGQHAARDLDPVPAQERAQHAQEVEQLAALDPRALQQSLHGGTVNMVPQR